MLLSNLWTDTLTFVRISPSALLLTLSSFTCVCKACDEQMQHFQTVLCVQHVFIIFSHVSKVPKGYKCVTNFTAWKNKMNSAKQYNVDFNNQVIFITKGCEAVNMSNSTVAVSFFFLQTALRNTFRLLPHMWNLLTRSLLRPAITR